MLYKCLPFQFSFTRVHKSPDSFCKQFFSTLNKIFKKLTPGLLFLFNKFIYCFWLRWVFVAACGLSLVGGKRGLLFVAVHVLLIAVASLVAEHGLYSAVSVVVAHGLSCTAACGIFPDPCPLH